jgi:uncharacterized cupin superfamily protein
MSRGGHHDGDGSVRTTARGDIMVEEARLEDTPSGRAPVTAGWFTVNIREAAWVTNEVFGADCVFEGDAAPFADVGLTLCVLKPGQPSGLYHSEGDQEDFLVLAGQCLLLIENEERPLHAWDFVHCPPGAAHIFVGAGEGPCVIFMTGGRTRESAIVYPRSELARRHGAEAGTATTSPAEAYAPFPQWQPGPAGDSGGLPWA